MPADTTLTITSYNVATAVATESVAEPLRSISTDATQAGDGTDTSSPYRGLLDEIGPAAAVTQPIQINAIIGPDGRTRVRDTTQFPWRTLVWLLPTFPNGTPGACSGAIVGNFHVLTAGHCIHNRSRGGWARSVEVVPALDDDYMPFGRAWVTYMHSYNGWTEFEDSRHDWAVLVLDRNIGHFTGWMGRQTDDPSSAIYTGNLNIAGYPTDFCGARCMAHDGDTGQSANTHNHRYWMDTMFGQSGSPVWRIDGSKHYILTVHTTGVVGGPNSGTRLHQDKLDRLDHWMRTDTPPVDKADLVDAGSASSGFNATTVKQSANGFSVWNNVLNIGTAGASGFRVSYYASADQDITPSDHLIGATTVASVAPFATVKAQWTGKFPSNIPPGAYYVGWIINSTGNVAEFDYRNNRAIQPNVRLTVTPNRVLLPIVINR